MRPRDLEAELHPSVIAARHLRATADLWPALHEALHPSGTTGVGTRTPPASRPPLDLGVSDVIGEINDWTRFWARALYDETRWEPPDNWLGDTPALLRALAQRTGHWTNHPDQTLAAAFVQECADTRRLAEDTAHPSGYRRIPVNRACDQEGCSGALYAPLSDSQWLPALRCSENPAHRVEPDQWSRPKWRRESA